MRSKSLGIIVILSPIAFLSVPVFTQSRPISREQFWAGLRNAYDAEDKIFPRRQTSEEKRFENGARSSSSKGIYEYLAADKTREILKDVVQGKPRILEVIRIGEIYYCRENEGTWKKESRSCGPMTLKALPIVVTQNYTVEETLVGGKTVTFYRSYIIHRGWRQDEVNTVPLRFSEDKFWVNPDGSIHRREMTDGFVDSKLLTSSGTDSFEYKVRIQEIRAPVK